MDNISHVLQNWNPVSKFLKFWFCSSIKKTKKQKYSLAKRREISVPQLNLDARRPLHFVVVLPEQERLKNVFRSNYRLIMIIRMSHDISYTVYEPRPPLSWFMATDPEVPGSIPGATRFSENYWVWNGGPLSLVSITKEILVWISRGQGLENRD
jgi:hypothetical protein